MLSDQISFVAGIESNDLGLMTHVSHLAPLASSRNEIHEWSFTDRAASLQGWGCKDRALHKVMARR